MEKENRNKVLNVICTKDFSISDRETNNKGTKEINENKKMEWGETSNLIK